MRKKLTVRGKLLIYIGGPVFLILLFVDFELAIGLTIMMIGLSVVAYMALLLCKDFIDDLYEIKFMRPLKYRRIKRRDMKNTAMWRDRIQDYAYAKLMSPKEYFRKYHRQTELMRMKDEIINGILIAELQINALKHDCIEIDGEIALIIRERMFSDKKV